MSSGEADVAEATRRMLAESRSLDAFTRCRIAGCEVRVSLKAGGEARCYQHGGPAVAQYRSSSTDATVIWSRFVALDDCE